MDNPLSRSMALDWLGIDQWFVREPALQRGAPPPLAAPIEQTITPSISAPEPASQRLPAQQPLSSVLTQATIQLFVSPSTECASLLAGIRRCIANTQDVTQVVAATQVESRIHIGHHEWRFSTLLANPAEKRRLWRILVGIEQ
ncbi:MAG: hypothetical protein ACYC3A_00840 [Halothiobacillus sp.]